jgi:hypothetical protein
MVDEWFASYALPAESLQTARRIYAAALLLVVWPKWLWVPAMSPTFFQPPPGLASLFTAPPPAWVFGLLTTIGVVASVCLLTGRAVTAASIAIPVVLWIGNSFEYAFGTIDYDVLFLCIPIVGLLARWDDGPGPRRAWPLALFALAIGLMVAQAGAVKFMKGWLDTGRLALRSAAIEQHILAGRESFSPLLLGVSWGLAWEAVDYGIVLFELAFLFAVFEVDRFRRMCALGCVISLATTVLLRIPLSATVLAYALFVPWPALRIAWRPPAWITVGLGAALSVLYIVVGNPLALAVQRVGEDPRWVFSLSIQLAGVIVGVVSVAREFGWRPSAPVVVVKGART